ncbi:MAG: hypothetical protein LAO05_15770 [Acidobacteriia bacterium]|nr:hypothetical protein [Terriglobia bacterium]
MAASLLAVLLAISTPNAFVRATVQPAVQCLSGSNVIVTLDNTYSRPLLVALSVEARSGDRREPWLVVHEDMFRREAIAPNKVVVAMPLAPGKEASFTWDLVGRKGPPNLRPGLHRIVASVTVPNLDWKVGSFEIARFELKECRR